MDMVHQKTNTNKLSRYVCTSLFCFYSYCFALLLYVFALCIGVAIGYFMTGCKSSQKCDAYGNTEFGK